MGIATVAGVLLVVVMVNSAGLFSHQSSKVQEGLNINDALSALRGSIKQAGSVADQYTDGPTTYTSGATQLVLKVSSIDALGNIITNTDDYFVFFLDSKYLRFKIFPHLDSSRQGINRVLSNAVDAINFQYFDSANPPVEVSPSSATKVRMTLTLKQKLGLNFEINTATSEVSLRND